MVDFTVNEAGDDASSDGDELINTDGQNGDSDDAGAESGEGDDEQDTRNHEATTCPPLTVQFRGEACHMSSVAQMLNGSLDPVTSQSRMARVRGRLSVLQAKRKSGAPYINDIVTTGPGQYFKILGYGRGANNGAWVLGSLTRSGQGNHFRLLPIEQAAVSENGGFKVVPQRLVNRVQPGVYEISLSTNP